MQLRIEKQVRHYRAGMVAGRVLDPAIEPASPLRIAVLGKLEIDIGQVRPLHDVLGLAVLADLGKFDVGVTGQATAGFELELTAGQLLFLSAGIDSLRLWDGLEVLLV